MPPTVGLYDPQTEHDACGIGFVAQLRGRPQRAIVEQALSILERLEHRGACGCDPDTGDGAGLLVQIPHGFFTRVWRERGRALPRPRRYAVGMVYLPADAERRAACEALVERIATEQGQRVIGWRDVPVDPDHVGPDANAVRPYIRQIFIERRRVVPSAFERRLFVIRRLTHEAARRDPALDPDRRFHIASLSCETVVYKGLLKPDQLRGFYPDLREPDFVSAIALLHSRFSTNTFPTWDLAQPFTRICHNGEINTVRGNRNWMLARRSQLQSAKFGGALDRLGPLISGHASDSRQFDQMLEVLHLGGRTLPHAMMMMIPEAWENDPSMAPERRAFYNYTASIMEPWDGPSAIAFTDGHLVGATLDRNGLRPARWLVTSDDLVVMASESGVVDVPASRVVRKGRLQPGRIFVVDTEEGRIIDDDEVKGDVVARWPYSKWLERNVFAIDQLEPVAPTPALTGQGLRRQQAAFGYTEEQIDRVIVPMARDGHEPIGAMGRDTPLAVLSEQAPSLFAYFHQLFAQVTNPPIDPIRERLVMSLSTAIGMGGNPFDETPEQCHRIEIKGPVLTNQQLATLRGIDDGVFEATTLSLCYPVDGGDDALEQAVDALCRAAVDALDRGFNLLVLSDRGVDADHAPIPALLATSAVHQHLVREGIRMHGGLIVETGDVREVHDVALLVGYGAAAVNPWLTFDTITEACETEALALDPDDAIQRWVQAADKGLLKVMSKMGISTISSYRGAQTFEAVGLDHDLVQRHFAGTSSRIGGVDLAALGREAATRHARGFSDDVRDGALPVGGELRWRRRGERHAWTPTTIASLQQAVRDDDRDAWWEYVEAVHADDEAPTALRRLLEFDTDGVTEIPLDEVEDAASIATRFVTGAMSFGSLSAEAHETLALAMNELGGRSNTGEGGEEPERWTPDPDGRSRRSAIKQIASGRFGVHTPYLVNADELQIKMAQGAKPGEGGQLPGHKVSDRIATVRCSTPGVTLISPPPHHDIYSIEDLAQLIYDLKSVNPAARVSVKLVSEVGVGTVAAGVAKARAEAIVIAGASGGTGASPISSIQHAGLPWELGLAETQQVLVANGLRGRVRLQVDGGLRTGRDVVIAGLLGAEEFGFSTAPLIALGCVMLRQCHQNTCSVGIATQHPELTKRFAGEPVHVIRFFLYLAEEIRQWMARLGIRRFDDLVGRVDLLRKRDDLAGKAAHIDVGAILTEISRPGAANRHAEAQDHSLEAHFDQSLFEPARAAIETGEPVQITTTITNEHRAVGSMLSGEIVRQRGTDALLDDTIAIHLEGSAGQSFGAWLTRGVTMLLEGDANDYVGKGLSGGRIAVYPPPDAGFDPSENVIVGNTVLYGATSGDAFFRGRAGERFAVRNSGARAVVEGCGDHGCEYMTGGTVVVLGETGRNFAAGMSGGVAYVYDRDGQFRSRCNLEQVELEAITDPGDRFLLKNLLEDHVRFTGSLRAGQVLDHFDALLNRFVRVMPTEYKRVLEARRAERPARVTPQPATWPSAVVRNWRTT